MQQALLVTYNGETVENRELIELPDNYDGDPYGATVPFPVGSNQTFELGHWEPEI